LEYWNDEILYYIFQYLICNWNRIEIWLINNHPINLLFIDIMI
jgi:hypothetical protein